jgi:hypothetical protein
MPPNATRDARRLVESRAHDADLPYVTVRRWITLGAVAATVAFVYLIFVSAGTLTKWPTYMGYFDLLAEGFRAHHLHLSVTPAPELVAQSNPFDPAHARFWLGDSSYYRGQYYLYWGPVPALLLAAVKTAFRISVPVGDQFLVYPFYFLQFLFGALILERMARRLFDGVPGWMVVLALFTFAFANPSPYEVATGGVYQTAIAGGQAFLLGGVFFAFDGVCARVEGRRFRGRFLMAGLFWGLAMGCRVSLPPTIFLLILTTTFVGRRVVDRRWSSAGRDLLSLGALPVAALGALLLYNKLRFDSWLDFGGSRQLSTLRYRISTAYLLPNLYSYLARPLAFGCRFPFVTAPTNIGPRGFPTGMTFPPGYHAGEPVAGLLIAVPVVWLSLGALVFAVRKWRRRPAAGAAVEADSRTPLIGWCTMAFAILSITSVFPVVVLFMPSMRQLADVTPGLVLLGILGTWWLYMRVRDNRLLRRLVMAAAVGTSVATIVIGLLLGYEGYNRHFHRFNPELDERLVRVLSVCRG